MAFGEFNRSSATAPLSEINMIPLIDVMLVLLVIFIITAPLLTHAVKIDLPKASSSPNLTKSQNIQLAIKADGELYWNGEVIEQRSLAPRLKEAAKLDPPPELHIRADRTAEYQKIAEVMSAAAKAGLSKIGFITEPGVTK